MPIYGVKNGELEPCSQQNLAEAIRVAVGLGADVINISGGEPSLDGVASEALTAAIQLCQSTGVLVVAAAGNDGCACLHVPAADPITLTVGAMNHHGRPMPFSNWGLAYRSSGILAPGQDIPGPVAGGGVRSRSGTSAAAAIVSGVAALLLSLPRDRSRNVDPQAVHKAMLASATPCDASIEQNCEQFLAGRLDVEGAVRWLREKTAETSSSIHAAVSGFRLAAGAAQLTDRDDPVPTEPRLSGVNDVRELVFREEHAMNDQLADTVATDSADSTAELEVTAASVGSHISGGSRSEMENSSPLSVGRTTAQATPTNEVVPADVGSPCCCECGGGAASLICVIGRLGFDFGSLQRQASVAADMNDNPLSPAALLNYLNEKPYAAADLIWTLEIDSVPLYAIEPSGPFAADGYETLRRLYEMQQSDNNQLGGDVQRVMIPGTVVGSVRLQSTAQVAVIRPAVRGIEGWHVGQLMERSLLDVPQESRDIRRRQFQAILDRFYYEHRNGGLDPADRAMNAAATMLMKMSDLLVAKITDDLVLQRIDVSRSQVSAPGSDYWDVTILFFHPHQMVERAREVFRFTVDVSDELPFRVGEIGTWSVHAFGE